MNSLVNLDAPLARMTARRDDEMDRLNKRVYGELLALMLQEKGNIRQATKLLFLSRFLERKGDHAVHICGWALYAITGEHEDL